ncbi:MAG: right-handed parallel beta-helix repeat-containing protein [Candidatus Hatepunaea meridiana]|nr:right-handed parallel beta-helix repeat-containing protein [Candidatus Hatepunaea meridiana]
MKKFYILLFTLFILLNISNVYSDTEVSGVVRGVWNEEGSPYIIENQVHIRERDSLRIEPGVEVRSGNYPFLIYGILTANGEEGDSIRFRPVGQDGWQGLRFLNTRGQCQLDYCVITNGSTIGEQGGLDSLSGGGNVFIYRSDVTINHSRISYGTASGLGGGIAAYYSEPTIDECLINENVSNENGGGIGLAFQSSGIISNCRIFNNSVNIAGGGIFFWGQSETTIEGCHIHHNSARSTGGGISLMNASCPHIHHSLFTQNTAEAGGAGYVRNENTSPLIEWCEFDQNSANIGVRVGGAFYIRDLASPELRYNRINRNNADYGGAIYIKEPPHCNIHHNLFFRNGATSGGGAFATSTDLQDTPFRLTNCTFYDNRDIGFGAEANTGYVREGASVIINSSILWGEEPHFAVGGELQVINSNVRYGFEGDGNSDEYPNFLDNDSTWFMLSGYSPCIDNGDPNLPEDPDSTRNDRGWLHFPQNAQYGILTDTLETALWVDQNEYLQFRYRNETGVPIYITPMDRWQPGEPTLLENVSDLTEDYDIYGVVWTGNGFYLSGSNNGEDPNMIYHLDSSLSYIDNFAQPGNPGGNGFADLAYGGNDILYGGYTNYIYEFTTDGEFGDRYSGPDAVRNYQALGADYHNPHGFFDFYISGAEGIIIRTDAEMWERARLEVGKIIYALGVKWNTRSLYIITSPEENIYLLSLVIPDDELIIPLYCLDPPDTNYTMGGIEITQDWETGRGNLTGIWRGEGEAPEMLFMYDLYTAWLDIRPEQRIVLPDEEVSWDIGFMGNQLDPGRYETSFDLTVNGLGGEFEGYARIETMSSVSNNAYIAPVTCRLNSIYPNPFNSIAGFTYYLSQPSHYKLSMTDLKGRLILIVASGLGQAGLHRGIVDAKMLPSGTYYLKLTTSGMVDTKSITIIK